MHTGTGEMPLSAKSNTQDSSAAGTALQCFSNTAGLCSQSSSASKPTCTCAAQTSPATPSRFRSTHPSLLQQKREECLVFAGTDLRSTSEPGQGLAFSCISTRCPSRPGHVLPCWLQGRESKAPAASVGPSSPITCSLAPVPIHTQQELLQAQPPAAGHISAALLPLDCHFPASLPFTSPVLDTALSESSCWPSVMGENQNGLWKKASQKGKICMILTPTFLTVTL